MRSFILGIQTEHALLPQTRKVKNEPLKRVLSSGTNDDGIIQIASFFGTHGFNRFQ